MSQDKVVNVLNFSHRGSFGTQLVILLLTMRYVRVWRSLESWPQACFQDGTHWELQRWRRGRRSAPQGAAERKEAQTLRWQPSKIAQHESLPQHPFLGFVGLGLRLSWICWVLAKLLPSFPNNQFHLWSPFSVITFFCNR